MKKILSLLAIFLIVLSCSSNETSTPVTPPPAPIAKYTISFSAGDGGTVSTTGGEYEEGQTVSVTATPQGEYLFTGWSDGNTDTTRTITVDGTKTLTANFEKKKYPLTVNIEGEGEVLEEIVNAGRTTDYDSGTTVKLTAIPSDGWEFVGWTGAVESTESEVQLLVSESKEVISLFQREIFISKQPFYSNINLSVGTILRNKYFPNKIYSLSQNDLYFNDEKGNYGIQDVSAIHFDYNKDGQLDFAGVAISNNLNGSGLVLVNDLYGQSRKDSWLTSDSNSKDISYHHRPISKLGDFNNDGNLDIIMGGTNSHNGYDSYGNYLIGENKSFEIYFFNEDGTFIIKEITLPTSAHDYDTGDIDNDGDIDLIFLTYRQDADLLNHRGGYPYIYTNDGLGNFSRLNSNSKFMGLDKIVESSIYNLTTRLFDIDGDGNLDLLLGGSYKDVPNQFTPKPSVYWGNGNSTFELINRKELTPSINLETEILNSYENNKGLAILGFSFIDFNKDGNQDILLIGSYGYYGSTYLLFMNNGDRTFTDVTKSKLPDYSNINSFRGGQCYNVFINDIDNDGDYDLIPDILFSDYGWDEYYFENTGGHFVREKFN